MENNNEDPFDLDFTKNNDTNFLSQTNEDEEIDPFANDVGANLVARQEGRSERLRSQL